MKMKVISVIMTADQSGAPDGIHLRDYKKGEKYDLPESLARAFIEDLDCAEEVSRIEQQDPKDLGSVDADNPDLETPETLEELRALENPESPKPQDGA